MNRFIQMICYMSLVCCSGSLIAKDLDVSQPLVCAIVEVLDCGLQDKCDRVDPQFVNLPDIFRMDVKKKEMKGGDRTTKIQQVTHEEGSVILQGTSGIGRGWSVLLSESTGKFTAAVAGYEYGFLVFGSCVAD